MVFVHLILYVNSGQSTKKHTTTYTKTYIHIQTCIKMFALLKHSKITQPEKKKIDNEFGLVPTLQMLMPQLDECELGKEQPLSLLSSVISLKLGVTRAFVRLFASPELGGDNLIHGKSNLSSSPLSYGSSQSKSSLPPIKNEGGSEMKRCCCIILLIETASPAKHSRSFVLLFL
jgi:hypothetical protein